jgi:hypothetical protein
LRVASPHQERIVTCMSNKRDALPKLLEKASASRFLEFLAEKDTGAGNSSPVHNPDLGERERIEELLALVNGGGPALTPERREALRAFLGERVAIREREELTRSDRVRHAARYGPMEPGSVPHRTLALSMAAQRLPELLNKRVRKEMEFTNEGSAKTVTGRLAKTGQAVSVIKHGPGGGLGVREEVHFDAFSTALNYTLALVLDTNRPFGLALCRCHAPDCGRFWLLPLKKSVGKPSRQYCDEHKHERKRLGDNERKQRERNLKAAALAAKHK